MRDITSEVRRLGAGLVVVGSGRPEQAAQFKAAQGIDFPLFTDPAKRTYRAAGLRRGLGTTFNTDVLKNSLRAFKKGFRQGWTQGDPWQQGGAFVFTPDNKVLFSFISRAGGDHPEPQALLAALPASKPSGSAQK